jgi:L-2-hydroxyglutarate oxidase LhgO
VGTLAESAVAPLNDNNRICQYRRGGEHGDRLYVPAYERRPRSATVEAPTTRLCATSPFDAPSQFVFAAITTRPRQGLCLYRVDTVVIGAGVVGLAIAREAARSGRDVIVLEASGTFGAGNSSRNSEVIHAGIYYAEGSLKAKLCTRGRDMLYQYCEDRGIRYRRCGKMIVATDPSQLTVLTRIADRARANGVFNLRSLTSDEARKLEPNLSCIAALHSPSTGIIDSHGLMSSLIGDAETAGAVVLFHAPVTGGASHPEGVTLRVGGKSETEIIARRVYNSAGIAATRVASTIAGIRAGSVPQLKLAKGNYFSLRGQAPFNHLIYPVPEAGGLGVHATLNLAGEVRFGPDVEWIDSEDYVVNPSRVDAFYSDIKKYWPELPATALRPDYAGIRPKLSGTGVPVDDFFVQRADRHDVHGLVNLFGIESPGLTACLALAASLGAD